MWNEQQTFLTSQLSLGESLLWSGPPKHGISFQTSDVLMIPFSQLWCGFAIFWETSVFFADAPWFFKLWGAPFVVIGLHLVVGRFFVDAWSRRKTYYGVTNERIIIVSGIFNKSVQSISLKTLSDITLDQRPDLSGTITFAQAANAHGWRRNFPYSQNNHAESPAFESIQNAKGTYDIIRNAQKAAA